MMDINETILLNKRDDLENILLYNLTNNIHEVINNERDFTQMLSVGILLGILILACIIGNVLVIIAILIERDLRTRPQYYLIFSLAVADLLVGLIVTPLGAWSTVVRAWTLGVALCDFWISVDVLVCTSSILHLVAIALDRYWSVTDVCYVQNRTPKRIFAMLGTVWIVSLLISLAPILGWKDSDFFDRVRKEHVCLISQQISYQVFSTATAFYIPLCAIICIYYKIMRAAKRRFKRERDRKTIRRSESDSIRNQHHHQQQQHQLRNARKIPAALLLSTRTSLATRCVQQPSSTTTNASATTTTVAAVPHKTKGCGDNSSAETISDEDRTAITCNGHCSNVETRLDSAVLSTNTHPYNTKIRQSSLMLTRLILPKKRRAKESSEMRREHRAWRTLVIITGTFVACWTPFFLISLYRPICQCRIPILLESITNWLGYLNSAINPIIYTVFSHDFRRAFQRIVKRICFIRSSSH